MDVVGRLGGCFRWIKEGKLKPAPVRVYAFSDVAGAHRDIESGTTVRLRTLLHVRLAVLALPWSSLAGHCNACRTPRYVVARWASLC